MSQWDDIAVRQTMTNEERLMSLAMQAATFAAEAASVLRFRHVDAPARFGELGSPQHAEIDPFKSGAA
jgi:hypothetical protein